MSEVTSTVSEQMLNIDQLLSELITILEEEVEEFNKLLDLLLDQKSLLVDGNFEDLYPNMKKQENLTLKMKNLEINRRQKAKLLAQKLSIPIEELTITRLTQMVGDKYLVKLYKLKESLTSVVDKINYINKENKLLMEHALRIIRENIKHLVGIGDLKSLYDKSGKPQNKKVNKRIINKIA